MSKPTIVLNIQTLIGGIVVINADASNSVEEISKSVEESLVKVIARVQENPELGLDKSEQQ